MNIRHAIIKWLAMGDAVLLNWQYLADGTMRTKEAGNILIDNLDMSHRKKVALQISNGRYEKRMNAEEAAVPLEVLSSQHGTFSNCFLRGNRA